MIVTYEQAVRLKELGFNEEVGDYYIGRNGKMMYERHLIARNWNKLSCMNGVFSAPSVAEALQWIRDEKKIPCGVRPEYKTTKVEIDHCVDPYYKYVYEYYDSNHKRSWNSFYTFPEAETALLTEILKYLESQ